eukprot:scaffold93191_cov72-Phaeocystis_antarctica.AAC.4
MRVARRRGLRAELFPSIHCGILAAAPGVGPVRRYAGVSRGRGARAGHASVADCPVSQDPGLRAAALPAQGRARRKTQSGVSAAIVATVGYAVYRVACYQPDRMKCATMPTMGFHGCRARHASSIYRSALACLANGFPETINHTHTHTTSRRLPRCYVCAEASLRLRLQQGPHVSTVIDASLSEHHEAERRVDQAHAADAQPQGEYGSRARRRSAHV